MAERTLIRLRACALFAAPVPLLVAFIIHPHLKNEFDTSAVAADVVADPARWVLAHIMMKTEFNTAKGRKRVGPLRGRKKTL